MSGFIVVPVDFRDGITYAYADALRAVAEGFDRPIDLLDDRIAQCVEILTAPFTAPANPIDRTCEGCLADPGEPCRPGCLSHADCEHDERTSIATCGICDRSWCHECDPGPSALCHWCHGRGYSTAPRGASS